MGRVYKEGFGTIQRMKERRRKMKEKMKEKRGCVQSKEMVRAN